MWNTERMRRIDWIAPESQIQVSRENVCQEQVTQPACFDQLDLQTPAANTVILPTEDSANRRQQLAQVSDYRKG